MAIAFSLALLAHVGLSFPIAAWLTLSPEPSEEVAAERHGRSMPLFFEGALNILVAILAAIWPDQTIVAIVYIVGAWALLSGGFLVVAAVRMRGNAQGEFLLGLLGVLAIVFGVVLFVWPGAAAVAFAWWIGIFALLFGVTMVSLAMRLKKRAGA